MCHAFGTIKYCMYYNTKCSKGSHHNVLSAYNIQEMFSFSKFMVANVTSKVFILFSNSKRSLSTSTSFSSNTMFAWFLFTRG